VSLSSSGSFNKTPRRQSRTDLAAMLRIHHDVLDREAGVGDLAQEVDVEPTDGIQVRCLDSPDVQAQAPPTWRIERPADHLRRTHTIG
jgi:hypothetical protein